MNKRTKNKLTFILDRFPYIIFIFIIGLSIVFFFIFRNNFPLDFFSGSIQTEETSSEEEEYNVFITSPSNNDVFSFINPNETIPVEIKANEIESTGYKVKVILNGETEIKTFNSPPYEFNWNPQVSGDYVMVARVIDEEDNIVARSNEVSFLVEYEQEESEETIISLDVEEKKEEALDNSSYRSQNGAPIFSYKCYTPPLVDGSISEWDPYGSFSSFSPTIKKENYSSHLDVSGTFFSCWDDDNLYFAIQVVDDVFNQSFTGNQINKGDSITIVIDTDLEGDLQVPFYNSDDFQIDFSPGNFQTIFPEAFINWPSNSPPKQVILEATRLSNGYILEASVPWYNFVNYVPEDMDVLGFTVSILDTDNLESTELVISSSTNFEINNVSTLGTLVLIDAGDLLETEQEEVQEVVPEEGQE